MKSKGLRYAFRDGFVNLGKYPLVLLASITTMFLMLFLLSSFIIFAMNTSHFMNLAGEQPPIEIQFKVGAAESLVRDLDAQLAQNPLILEHRVFDPESNFEMFKKRIGKQELFDEFDYNRYIPWTIQLRLSDPSLSETLRAETLAYPCVQDVLMESRLMEFLESTTRNVGIGGSVVFVVLTVIAIFIIANMIRVAALSRSTEIAIMKYMGATNQYISIPFVIEGLAVGFFSALFAGLVIFLCYHAIAIRSSSGFLGSGFQLLSKLKVLPPAFLLNLAVGMLIGGLTSAIAVRKYVRV